MTASDPQNLLSVIYIMLKVVLGDDNAVLFSWKGHDVSATNVFTGEDARLPCFTTETINNRSGKTIPDEKRVFWEYKYDLEDNDMNGKAFFIAKHVELPPSRYEEKEEVDYTVFADGGDAEGEACVFPFSAYDNETRINTTYYTCADAGKDDKRCWCSTVPYHNSPSTWGFCPCAAPQPEVTLYAEYGTDPGAPCVFPFYYKERVFYECTREFDKKDRCWCATTKYRDDKKNNKYGFCPCAGPPFTGEWSPWSDWTDFECGKVTYRTRECKRPKNMRMPVGVGRHLFCDGSSFEFELSDCKDHAGYDELHIISLRKRTSRIGNSRTDNSIKISPVVLDDSALVVCTVTREHLMQAKAEYRNPRKTAKLYLLNVLDKSKVKEVYLDGDSDQSTPKSHKGYRVEYRWDDWSICNRCGDLQGEQKKGGFCYTRDVRGERDLPCSSRLLTAEQRKALADLPNYVAYRQCNTTCVEDVRFIKASPNIKPPRLKFAHREIVNLHYGDKVRLDCDYNRTNLPSWQYDDPTGKKTVLIDVRNNTETRFIDVLGRLTLINAQDKLEGYYGCFIKWKLRRTYRIFVGKNLSDFQKVVSRAPPYIRIGIIALIFVSIALKVVTTRIK